MSKRYQGGILGVGFNPLQAPNAPTGVSATAGDTTASVSFTAPTNVGGSAITGYTVQSNPGGVGATGSASPITVTGLSNGTAYTFNVWALNTYGPSPAGVSGSVTPSAPVYATFGGGDVGGVSPARNVIDYVNINTIANATDFGDLTVARYTAAACSSSTRGVFIGGSYYQFGAGTYYVNVMDYVTFASAGNAVDFGDYNGQPSAAAGCGSSTRGVVGGGNFSGISYSSAMEYITIASTGNSTSFGLLTYDSYALAACSSPTRGIFAGGFTTNRVNTINYITIASTGNATYFGDLSVARYSLAGLSSSTRGVFGGGVDSAGSYNVIDYITIGTTGNATDFGDLVVPRYNLAGCSSPTRGVFAGGTNNTSLQNVIDYITISTTSNTTDFGDLTLARASIVGCSSGHGGI